MNTTDRAGALAAFDAWQDASPPQREALLSELPAAQRERLEALIKADRAAEAGGFLKAPAQLPHAPELAGQALGAWTLVTPLGSGGMGEVWRARRSDGAHHGEAAIKLLHSPWRGEGSQARFRREGELLARLTHPNIARLLDIGEALLGATRTRYLVLELVEGERIDRWCEAQGLDVASRLQLFLQVCDAVAHAHARLVVHRDLKPGNILVNAEGQVKLLDFGVAKLLADDTGAELTAQLPAGLTPEYAAPEQLRGEPVSTATDVFALGRLLCLLLTGQREPGPTLRGDLALIVGRALKERPDERYAGASALADDVRRHLEHRPILARPDSLAYRGARFARRYRLQLAALSLVLASLLAGMGATAWQWREATREAARTRRVQSVLTELLSGLSPDASGSATVPMLELLRRSWAEAKRRLAGDPELLAEVARPLGLLLNQSGDMALAAEALSLAHARLQGRGDEGREVALQFANTQRRLGNADAARRLFEPLAEGNDAQAVIALANLGEMAAEAGELARAEAMLRRVEPLALARFGAQHEAYRKSLDALANLARAQGRWDEARARLAQLVQASAGVNRLTAAQARASAATLEMELGRYASAVPMLQASVAELGEVLGPGDATTVYTRAWLAGALFHDGDIGAARREAEAAAEQAQALAEPDAAPLVALTAARLQLRGGEAAAAEARLQALQARLEATGAPAAAARALALRGEAALRQGHVDEARRRIDESLARQRQLLPAHDADLWPTLALKALCQPEMALQPLAEALQVAQAGLADGHPDRARVAALQALFKADRAARDAALQAYAQALSSRRDAAAAHKTVLALQSSPAPAPDARDALVLLSF
ncbi:protein kinase domain-containing protein [Roseateles sp. NT4]|uniref:protein kinase domain-containing protein n=1 Tax=Roseateles sp. NT4 TaxID=3453715 RepID=UPI003EE842C1